MSDAASSHAIGQRFGEIGARQAFLLEFSDALCALDQPAAIEAAAARLCARHLRAGRAVYAAFTGEDGQQAVVRGWYVREPLSGTDPGTGLEMLAAVEALGGDGTVAVADVSRDPRLGDDVRTACRSAGIRALVGATVIRQGRPVAFFGVCDARPRAWTPADAALVQEIAERTWRTAGRARTVAALRESEYRYRSLFQSMGEGLGVVEVLTDPETGIARGYRIVETNPAFDRVFGPAPSGGADAADPDRGPRWLEIYGRVAATGIEQRFTAQLPADGRAFDVHVFRVGEARERKVAVLLTDVTRSRAAEQVLRWNQLRQQALLEFGDAARATTDPRLIMAMAARLIGLRLGADRVGYAEVERERAVLTVVDAWSSRPDIPAVDGTFPLAEIGQRILRELAQGRLVAVDDVTDDARLDPDERTGYARAQIGAFVAEPLLRQEGLRAILFVHQRVPRTWTGEERELVSEFGQRTWAELDRARAEEALRVSEERFREFGEASSDILWIRDAQTLRFEFVSPAFERIYGGRRRDLLGGDPDCLVADEDRERVLSSLERVRGGERVTQEFRIVRADTGRPRWVRDTSFPLIAGDGTVQRIGGIRQDITEEKETGDRLRVLVAELQHRTRNLIAVVRALADKTMQDHADDGAFDKVFGERLDALARAQGLLSRLDGDRKVAFDTLLREELAGQAESAREGGRVQVEGPAGVRLRSRSVQTLALALHELVTNAVKYGALAHPGGSRLRVGWHVEREADGCDWLHVDWRESGVRLPDAAPRLGYGRELIERALPFQLGARTCFRMTPDGVHCTLAVPIAQEGEDA